MLGGTNRIASAVATATALVLTSACQGDPEPIEPTSSATTSATPSAAPIFPKVARRNTAEGATALVDYWMQSLNYAFASGRTSALESVSAPSCDGCSSYVKTIRTVYTRGGDFRNKFWQLDDITVERKSGRSTIYGLVTASAGTFRRSAEAKRSPGQAEQFRIVVDLSTKDAVVAEVSRGPNRS